MCGRACDFVGACATGLVGVWFSWATGWRIVFFCDFPYGSKTNVVRTPSSIQQVSKHGEIEVHQANENEAKRTKLSILASGSFATSRHRAWLQRSAESEEKKAWRPFTMHRIATKRWLQDTDTQWKTITCRSGWAFVAHDPKLEIWAPAAWST